MLYEAVYQLGFNKLNTENKAIVIQMCEQVFKTIEEKPNRVRQKVGEILQSQINDDGQITFEDMLDDFPMKRRTEILSQMPINLRKQTGMANFQQELWRLHTEKLAEEIISAFESIDVFAFFEQAH